MVLPGMDAQGIDDVRINVIGVAGKPESMRAKIFLPFSWVDRRNPCFAYSEGVMDGHHEWLPAERRRRWSRLRTRSTSKVRLTGLVR